MSVGYGVLEDGKRIIINTSFAVSVKEKQGLLKYN
jgi:hypothetical protein